MSTKEIKLPSWFNGDIYEEGGIVQNRFSGEEYELNNVELSIYDFIIGASIVAEMGILNSPHHIQELRKGLDWFRKNNPEAYMVLLD
jgi:hypothetical protein